jgi:hypothetical protein
MRDRMHVERTAADARKALDTVEKMAPTMRLTEKAKIGSSPRQCLLERLKKRAAESGTRVSGLIERAVIRNNVPCVALESISPSLNDGRAYYG